MVSWSFVGRRSVLASVGALLAGAGRNLARSRAAILPVLRLAARMSLTLAAAGLAVAGVFVLAGLGWSLLAGAVAALFLEWVIKDASPDARQARREHFERLERARRADLEDLPYRNGAQ